MASDGDDDTFAQLQVNGVGPALGAHFDVPVSIGSFTMNTFRGAPADGSDENTGGSYVYSPRAFDVEMSDNGVNWKKALRNVQPGDSVGGSPWRTDGQTFGPFVLPPNCGNCTFA